MEACSWQPAWAAYIIPRLTRVIWQRKSGHSPAVITFSLWSLSPVLSREPALASDWSASVIAGFWLADDDLLPSSHRMLEELEPGLRLWENKHLRPDLNRPTHFLTNENVQILHFYQWADLGLKYAVFTCSLSDGWTAVVCSKLIQPSINKPWAWAVSVC